MKAKDVMSTPVVTVTPDAHVRRAAKLLTNHGFATLPVVDEDERLLGVVTEGELLWDRVVPGPRTATIEDGGPPRVPPAVATLMTTAVVTAGPETHVATLTRLMLDGRVQALPIADDGVLIGIVTRRDLLRTLARDDGEIARDVDSHLSVAGRLRWDVTVADGMVSLTGEGADETERHTVAAIAGSLPGVVGVRVLDARP